MSESAANPEVTKKKNKFRMKIKHPVYEVPLPILGKNIMVRALTFKDKNKLVSNTMSKASSINLLYNVIWDLIETQEVFESDFDNFMNNIGWDDFIAILIGVLNISNSSNGADIKLKIKCDGVTVDEAGDEVPCRHKYNVSFMYQNLISNFSKSTEPIYGVPVEKEIKDYNVKLTIEYPTIYKDLSVLFIIEKLRDAKKLFKKMDVSEKEQDLYLTILLNASAISKISDVSNPEEFIEFNYDLDSPDCLETAIDFASTLADFVDLDFIDDAINPNNYGIECKSEVTCPKCKTPKVLDLKEWILDSFFPQE